MSLPHAPHSRIHVVSLQVPFPADYGGVIDIYYKLKALKEAGYEVWLHTFCYGREPAEELNAVADRVFYYPRHHSLLYQLSIAPYIVSSRHSSKLLADLLADDAPILFEGIHCCGYLAHRRLRNRIKLVRMHNVEQDYYKELSQKASGWKKLYYTIEAVKLKRYEKKLRHANAILAITESDRNYFETTYPHTPTLLLPAFHAESSVAPLSPKENYILYHGNLSVEENIEAAEYILRHIVPLVPNATWIFAGKNPSGRLVRHIARTEGTRLVANPSAQQMSLLIGKAAINLLITFQPTGLKLKLLTALFAGGHCLVNSPMLTGTGLDKACIVADTPGEMASAIEQAMQKPFDETARLTRITLLELYDNRKNIDRITGFMKNQKPS